MVKSEASFYDQYPYPDIFSMRLNLLNGCNYEKAARSLGLVPKKNPRILSLGCGVAQPAGLAVANSSSRILAVDFSTETLKLAKRLAQAKKVAEKIKFRTFNLDSNETLPDKGTFDLIVVTCVLHHLAHPERVFKHLQPHIHDKTILRSAVYSKAHIRWKKPVLKWLKKNKITQAEEFYAFLKKQDSKIKNYILKRYKGIPSAVEINDCFFHYRESGWSRAQYKRFFTKSGFNYQEFDDPNEFMISSIMRKKSSGNGSTNSQ